MIGPRVTSLKYAKAIFNSYGDVVKEFEESSEIIDKNIEFFKNPSIPINNKIDVLNPKLSNIFRIIISKGHIEIVGYILKSLKRVVDESNGKKYFEITSAYNNEKEIVNILKEKYGDISYSFSIKEDLISGFVVKKEDKVLDFSLKKDLDKLRSINFKELV